MRNGVAIAAICIGAGWLAPAAAPAFGPDGHRIAGLLAEPLLCDAAAAQIAALTDGSEGGAGLDEIGVWADAIRTDDGWAHTLPWHYLNIDDDEPIGAFKHTAEGDVLWAIEHYSERLASNRPRAARLEALRFVVHFVVDIHQPLHVGRASDRGGNTIDVRFDGKTVNLHRFWDTDALRIAGRSPREYAQGLDSVVARSVARDSVASPQAWAAESRALRSTIYAFERPARGPAMLENNYLDRAERVMRTRLAQAAVRLAGTLNRVLAPSSACRAP